MHWHPTMLRLALGAAALGATLLACEPYYVPQTPDYSSSNSSSGSSTSSSSSGPPIMAIAEERLAPVRHRLSMKLLLSEIEQMEQLSASGSIAESEQAAFVERMASSYAELVLWSVRNAAPEEHDAVIRAATPKAHEWLVKLMAQQNRREWAIYVDGLVEEQAGDPDRARADYELLVQYFPTSALAPLATMGAKLMEERTGHQPDTREAKNDSASGGTTSTAPESTPGAPQAKHPAARATGTGGVTVSPGFISQGEMRVMCPIGYHAKMGDDQACGCMSTNDANEVLSIPADDQCVGTMRAEADECIVKCGDKPPS